MNVVIGDIHGDFRFLKRLIANNPEWTRLTIAGDIGLGFPDSMDVPFESPIPIRFIRGNHDNPDFIRNLPPEWAEANWHYIPDGTIEDEVLYIGGAFSIDHMQRTPGFDWWYGEELNQREQSEIIEKINNYDGIIKTVVSHDCPYDLYPMLVSHHNSPNMTSAFLHHLLHRVLLDDKKPYLWFHGHHHKARRNRVLDVEFRTLAEAQTGHFGWLTLPKVLSLPQEQQDLDEETKEIISENQWELYD